MRNTLSYLIRKYPSVRFIIFFFVSGLIVSGAIFFSSSTIYPNVIFNISPQIAKPGERIVIEGRRFGLKSANAWINIGKNKIKSEDCLEWTDVKIMFEAPEDLNEDIVSVVAKNKQGNSVLLINQEILPIASHTAAVSTPCIDSIDINSGNVGEVISIYGKNFGRIRNNSIVVFLDAGNSIFSKTSAAQVASAGAECSDYDFDYDFWSDRELRIRIPDGADSGSIVVITDAGMSNPIPFFLKTKYGTKKYTDKRMYHLTSEVEISDFRASSPNTFFLRIPMPQKTRVQRNVAILSVSSEPFVSSYQGVSIYRFHDVSSQSNIYIRQEYSVERSKIETAVNAAAFKNAAQNNPLLHTAYTEATALLPADDPIVKKLCKAIIKTETNPYIKAHRIYTYLQSEVKLKEMKVQDSGRSIITALEEKNGDAYDIALLFCTMARAADIPAIPSAGILINENNQTMLHWWAEFYLNGFGWVPVDLALASGMPFDSGVPEKEKWYFGNLDAYHIAFTRGYQSQAPMLPNGRTTERKRSYAFRSIWEETTANIEGYSSLWRLPKVTGIY